MGVPNDWSATDPLSERRSRRTACLAQALQFQLDACRETESLAAIVVSDDLGFCVAHSGGDGVHVELAAHLPLLVGPAGPGWTDSVDDPTESTARRSLVVTTFSAAGSRLHACVVEPPRSRSDDGRDAAARAALDRVVGGFSRILAQ